MNLFEALSECEEYLTQFGGHKIAAGLTINISVLDKFTEKINKYADEHLTESDMIPHVKIDCSLSERALTLKNVQLLSKLEPFGVGNEKPVFSLSGAELMNISAVGSEGRHLRVSVRRGDCRVNGIGFHLGALAERFKIGDTVSLAFQMDINTYQGKQSVQLLIKDMQNTQKGRA